MACNLISRLFRRRTWRLPVSDNPNPPALPVHSGNISQLEQCLKQVDLGQQTHDELFLLGCLTEQGSYILSIPDVPFGVDNVSVQQLQDLSGFIKFESGVSDSLATSVDVFVHFSTAAEAALAMASTPTLTLENGTVRRLQHDHRDPDTVERAAKRQKTEPVVPPPKCLVCCEELPGPHVRPCLCCDKRWCYDCLKTNFSVALNDPERFPAKCCGKIMHFDVARGLVPPADHSKYRTRFEEHSTTKPVYCANSICSMFLPPRLAKPDKRGRVLCFSCQGVTCSQCRVVVQPADAETHACTAADEITALMSQFEYKRCPRCNTGVARMYGCSHIRCQCGAHWCWDCQRAIQICWSKPCDRAREDGEMTDDYEQQVMESDSDDDTTIEASVSVFADGAIEQTMPANDTNTELSNPVDVQPSELQTTVAENLQARPPSEVGQEGEPSTTGQTGTGTFDTPSASVIGQIEQGGDGNLSTRGDADVNLEPILADDPRNTLVPTVVMHDGSAMDIPRVAINDSAPEPGQALIEYRPPAALTTTPSLPTTQAAPEVAEPFVNLDSEDQDDWQHGEYDFGDEPVDESWDTWGCLHHFNAFQKDKMHEYWLPKRKLVESMQSVRQIDCLRCYKTITLTESVAEEKKVETGRKDSGVEIPLPNVQNPDEESSTQSITTTATEPDQKSNKKRKNKKDADASKLFNCAKCGVIYCTNCRKATMKELRMVMESNTIRD